MQSLFEAAMYSFVFLWTPALSPNGEVGSEYARTQGWGQNTHARRGGVKVCISVDARAVAQRRGGVSPKPYP
jgi:hypothetical protein